MKKNSIKISEKTPEELVELAVHAFSPYVKHTLYPMTLAIAKGHLQMFPKGANGHGKILVMHFTEKMLREGLSGPEWHALQKALIKHRKELKD